MIKYSLIASYSETDLESINLSDDTQKTVISFLDDDQNYNYSIGKAFLNLAEWGYTINPIALDLSILATLISVADTKISRKDSSDNSWTREIDLYLPVHNTSLWYAQKSILEEILRFLSGDIWNLFFREVPFEHPALITQGLIPDTSHDCVCLFSGGLDSFTGAIDLVSQGRKPLFVSQYQDFSTSKQQDCFNVVNEKYDLPDNSHLRANVTSYKFETDNLSAETTQRARSFLFLALAALVASCLNNCEKIYIPENGLISLNVPLDPLRLGAWSTKTTHPFYLYKWNELLSNLGLCGVENPYRFKTKGEMLSECLDQDLLSENIGITISCSSMTKTRWRGQAPGHCGYCFPCLIRRSAIKSAFDDDPTPYVILNNLQADNIYTDSKEGINIHSFKIMETRLLSNANISKILVHKSGPLSSYSEIEIEQYGQVFYRGIIEVGSLLTNTRLAGRC